MVRKTFFFSLLIFYTSLLTNGQSQVKVSSGVMMFGDSSRLGVPFAKDPHVVRFQGRFLMYYSVPAYKDKAGTAHGWGIAVAKSSDLISWERIGEVNTDPGAIYESKGMCAPCALVIGDKIHLFYQTYGNGKKDAICHAYSSDGIRFIRNKTNPVFSPDGAWNCGRAIDAEVVSFKGRYFLYYATRDSAYKIQMQGVAVASGNSDFNRNEWQNISTAAPMMKPELAWERDCIEGASVICKGDVLYMFYAGAYNNAPQQIGVASSSDGIHWKRMSENPFLPNGKPGEWNESESGHPHIFDNPDGEDYLFYQGNNTKGKNWFISNVPIGWENGVPYVKNTGKMKD
ncbi:MAG TPA: family 43 glycosylhydrolase [Prolixibacteraceae bacterium]|nr:family 43 glycosylhydrolase [Prolixibacteraceae bacterium]